MFKNSDLGEFFIFTNSVNASPYHFLIRMANDYAVLVPYGKIIKNLYVRAIKKILCYNEKIWWN